MPYAKSVRSVKALHGSKPDPGLLFDCTLSIHLTICFCHNADSLSIDEKTRREICSEPSRDKQHAVLPCYDHHTRYCSILTLSCIGTLSRLDIFRTNRRDSNISDTSSYLDLSPLYGKDQEAQNTVRTFQDGKLKPDTFAEERLIGQPPGVCVMLVMYSRFHNYVAENIAAINENNRFSQPRKGDPDYDRKVQKRDNDLFQTARLYEPSALI